MWRGEGGSAGWPGGRRRRRRIQRGDAHVRRFCGKGSLRFSSNWVNCGHSSGGGRQGGRGRGTIRAGWNNSPIFHSNPAAVGDAMRCDATSVRSQISRLMNIHPYSPPPPLLWCCPLVVKKFPVTAFPYLFSACGRRVAEGQRVGEKPMVGRQVRHKFAIFFYTRSIRSFLFAIWR